MAEYKGLNIVFEGDATSLSATLAKIRRDASQAQGELTGIQNALKFDPKNVTLLGDKAKQMTRSFTDAKARVDAFDKGMDQLKTGLDAARKAMQRMSDEGEEGSNAYQVLSKEVEHYSAELEHMEAEQHKNIVLMEQARQQAVLAQSAYDLANSKVAGFGTTLVEAGNIMTSMGNGLSRLWNVLGTLEIAGRLLDLDIAPTQVISNAEEFGNKIAQVSGYLDVEGENLEAMRQLALKWGKDTKYSATEAADAISELAKGGMTQAQIEGGALEATMLLASAGNISMADAAGVAVTAIKTFGLAAGDASEVADALAGAANKSTAEVDSLASAFKYVGGWATLAQWNINDVSGALGLLADHGMQGEMAGTALRNVMQRVAAPTDKAAAIMEKYGIQVRDASGHMKSATEIVDELNEAFDGIDEETRDEALNSIFGARALPAAIALMEEGSEGLQKYIDATKTTGYAAEMAQDQLGDLGWALELLRGEAETASVNLGASLEPRIIALAEAVEDCFEWFNSLSDSERDGIVNSGLWVAAAGPMLSVFGRISSGVGKAVLAVSGFMSAANPSGAEGTVRLVDRIATAYQATGTAASQAYPKAAAFISGMKSLLIGAGIAAAIGIVVKLYADWRAEIEKTAAYHRKFNDVVRDMGDDASLAATEMDVAARSVKEYGDAADIAASDLDGLLDKMEKHNEAINSSRKETNDQVTMLNDYMDVINELGGKGEASADDMARLQWAVDGVNEVLGTNYTASDILQGKWQDEEDTIDDLVGYLNDLIEKYKEEARVKAYAAQYEESVQAESEAASEVVRARKEYNDKLEETRQIQRDLMRLHPNLTEDEAWSLASTSSRLEEYNTKLEEANTLHDEAANRSDQLAKAMENEAAAVEATDGSLEAYLRDNSWDLAMASLQEYNIGLGTLQKAMEDAGLSVESLGGMTEEQFMDMVIACGGDIDKIIRYIAELNGVEIEDKEAKVDADTSALSHALGGDMAKWQDTDLKEQVGVAESDTSNFSLGDLLVWNMFSPKPQRATATAETGGVERGTETLRRFESEPFGRRSSSAVLDYSSVMSGVSWMQSAMSEDFYDREATVTLYRNIVTTTTTKQGHAAGGWIPRHASGGYVTSATMTQYGLVGENGTEYYDGSSIIPLTNRRYAKPFIDLLAEGLASKQGGGDTYYSIGSLEVPSGSALAGAMEQVFDMALREARA